MGEQDLHVEVGSNEFELIEFYIDAFEDQNNEPVRSFFGVNVAKVLEVIESPELTPKESAEHPCFLGTIPLRDIILPVLDLSIWLDMERSRNEHEVILVTEFNGIVTGFLVSGVTQIHRVSWRDVKPPSQYLSHMETNCITSMVDFEDHFALILDLEKILCDFDSDFAKEAPELTNKLGRALRALIVDDSTTLRYLIKEKLEQADFVVETLNDGQEAWDFLVDLKDRSQKDKKRVVDYYDILISDIEMPRMDGYTLTRHVKGDATLKTLPVMLFSSMITDAQRHKGDSVGADDQVSKPEFVELASRAMDLIQKNHPELAV